MDPSDGRDAAERLRLALDLFAAGEALMCQNLRRRFPNASDDDIERRLIVWLAERPIGQSGDVAGQPSVWPRAAR